MKTALSERGSAIAPPTTLLAQCSGLGSCWRWLSVEAGLSDGASVSPSSVVAGCSDLDVRLWWELDLC